MIVPILFAMSANKQMVPSKESAWAGPKEAVSVERIMVIMECKRT
jgi:hypothetical protein